MRIKTYMATCLLLLSSAAIANEVVSEQPSETYIKHEETEMEYIIKIQKIEDYQLDIIRKSWAHR